MTTNQFALEEMQAFYAEELRLAESELEVALLFADLSSTAYRVGRLKRASDTRSKADSLCSRAAARLHSAESGSQAESKVREVLNKLADLPQLSLHARAAG